MESSTETLINDRIIKAKEANKITESIIWNKIRKWVFIPIKEKQSEWYLLYKKCVINIYKMNKTFLQNNLIKFKEFFETNKMNKDEYICIIHNIMFLLFHYSEDTEILELFYNHYENDIDLNYKVKLISSIVNPLNQKKIIMEATYLESVLGNQRRYFNVVKFLVEKCGNDVSFIDNNKLYLTYFVKRYHYKYDYDIVKYLVNNIKMNLEKNYTDNILLDLCKNKCSDLKILKLLVEEYKMDISENIWIGCMQSSLCEYKSAYKYMQNNMCEIFGYLIENIDISNLTSKNIMSACVMPLKLKLKYLNNVKNLDKLNALIDVFSEYSLEYKGEHKTEKMLKLICDSIDPSLLNDEHKKFIFQQSINDPFMMKYNDFVIAVDRFQCSEDHYLSFCEKEKIINETKIEVKYIDHTKQTELLFIYNGDGYYGYNEVRERLSVFADNLVPNDPAILEGDMTPYLLNTYLTWVTAEKVDLNKIDPKDLLIFLKIVEEYPSTSLSINKIESELIDYIELNNLELTDEHKQIFKNCQLKKMYYHMHNKKRIP